VDAPFKRAKALNLVNSEKLWSKACQIIPGGTQTFSKAPAQHVDGVSPRLLQKSAGCRAWDVDGNSYIDYMMALGPNILGYGDKDVIDAANEGAKLGLVSSLAHPLEIELAEVMASIIPSAQMVRFGKNGSDVTTAAVRVARAFTGREKILVCGYHGWHDWYIGSTSRNLGVPKAVQELTMHFNYNDVNSLEKIFESNSNDIAAVIIEPVNFSDPLQGFLQVVKSVAHENGSVLIFDEVITGFRMDIGGAQSHYDVVPDLACFGKAMANGYPISALVGRADIMSIFEQVFFSGTFSGELGSISAALRTIKEIKRRGTIEHISEMGSRLISGYNEIVASKQLKHLTKMSGFGWWPEYSFYDLSGKPSLEIQSLFQQEIVRRGILTRSGMFICGAHSPGDIEETLKVFEEALSVVSEAVNKNKVLEWLDGKVIEPVIRSK